MSRYDHKIETSLEGIEHLSKEKKEEKERKMKEKNKKCLKKNKEKRRGIKILTNINEENSRDKLLNS